MCVVLTSCELDEKVLSGDAVQHKRWMVVRDMRSDWLGWGQAWTSLDSGLLLEQFIASRAALTNTTAPAYVPTPMAALADLWSLTDYCCSISQCRSSFAEASQRLFLPRYEEPNPETCSTLLIIIQGRKPRGKPYPSRKLRFRRRKK